MPLPRSFFEVGERLAAYFARGGDPPYIVYQYSPREEFAVRHDLGELKLWLGAPERGIKCEMVSLARLFWEALVDSGWADALIQQEEEAAGDHAALEELYQAVGEVLREPPTLPDRVVTALEQCDDHTAAFLYRAGALYPAYRTSTLLDDLRSRLRLPVTLLYPGGLVGNYGLRFMDLSEPAYGYRAHIIPRGEKP